MGRGKGEKGCRQDGAEGGEKEKKQAMEQLPGKKMHAHRVLNTKCRHHGTPQCSVNILLSAHPSLTRPSANLAMFAGVNYITINL